MSSPPEPIRVFIADDSAVSRLALREMLSVDADLVVVGEAADGKSALAAIPRLVPDVVLMDVMMPVLNGIETTRRLMNEHPVPIVLVSDHVGTRANLNFEALEAGALEILRKPSHKEVHDADARVRLARRVRVLSKVPVLTRRRRPVVTEPRPEPLSEGVARPAARFRRVLIGASTGGPVALSRILAGRSLPWPVVVVQHIAAGFAEGLATWFESETGTPAQVVRAVTPIDAGHIYLAPDGEQLRFQGTALVPDSDHAGGGHRPSVDVLFHSAVDAGLASDTIAILLTGMGRDGAEGLLALRRAGAWTIAQDEATAVVDGMPAAARELGAARETLALERIGPRLEALAGTTD